MASFSAISAPFGLKLAESRVLVQRRAVTGGAADSWVLTYPAGTPRAAVGAGQRHLLQVQQHGEDGRARHRRVRRTHMCVAGEQLREGWKGCAWVGVRARVRKSAQAAQQASGSAH